MLYILCIHSILLDSKLKMVIVYEFVQGLITSITDIIWEKKNGNFEFNLDQNFIHLTM